MPYRLIKYGLSNKHPDKRMFRTPSGLKESYDAVIIGAGARARGGLLPCSRLWDNGRCGIGEGVHRGGGTGRNTAIIRSNYLTPEGVKFYDESIRLFKDLSGDFDLNLFYSERGHFTLAHSDSAIRTMRWRAEVNKHMGVDSEYVEPEDVKAACPPIDLTCGGDAPIMGALYHPPGAIARHDAVAWGYGAGATSGA